MYTFTLLALSFFLLQVSSQNNDYCPNDCNISTSNGQCSTSRQQCICNEGFFDKDCGVKVTELQNGLSETLSITPGSWGYLYISLDGKILLSYQSLIYFYIKTSLEMQS